MAVRRISALSTHLSLLIKKSPLIARDICGYTGYGRHGGIWKKSFLLNLWSWNKAKHLSAIAGPWENKHVISRKPTNYFSPMRTPVGTCAAKGLRALLPTHCWHKNSNWFFCLDHYFCNNSLPGLLTSFTTIF